MSPIIYVGPRCIKCDTRPVWRDDHCSACANLLEAFGHDPAWERALRSWLEAA